MSFRFKRGRRLGRELIRVGRKRLAKAEEGLAQPVLGDAAAHAARKRFQEIRALLRLMRPHIGEKPYHRLNRTFRDLGRPLAGGRDAQAMADALDRLVDHFRGKVRRSNFAPFRAALLRHQKAESRRARSARRLEPLRRKLAEAGRAFGELTVAGKGWKTIERGLRRAYARSARLCAEIQNPAADEIWHEWRKQTKHLRQHLKLLRAAQPRAIGAEAERAHRLTRILGADHDLVVLRAFALAHPRGRPLGAELLTALIDEKRAALQAEARSAGRDFFRESPKEFSRRLKRYWKG